MPPLMYVIALELTDETENFFKRIQEVATRYLNRHEKTNMLLNYSLVGDTLTGEI